MSRKNRRPTLTRQRKLHLENLEGRRLMAVDFANAIPVGEMDYVSLPNASFAAGFEQTVRVQAQRNGLVTAWSQNLGQGVADVAIYDSNQNLLASATTGVRRVDVSAAIGDQFYVYINAPQAVASTNVQLLNLLQFNGSTATLHAPVLGSGITPRTSNGSVQTAGVDGFSVSRVDYTDAGTTRAFIQQEDGKWIENSSIGTLTYNELRRDKWSVYMTRGNEEVQLDLFKGKVITDGLERFNIVRSFDVTGRTANSVAYVRPGGTTGYFYKTGNIWTERFDTSSANAPQTFTYQEVLRDDWSVVLRNTANSSLEFKLDLNTKTVKRGASTFYNIQEASQAPGWLDGLGGNHTYKANASRSNHWVEINGLRYNMPASSFGTINVDGGTGVDKLTAEETGGNDAISAQGTSLNMSGAGYQMGFMNFEDTTTVYSGGNDTVTMNDRANAADHFFSNQTAASVASAILYGLDGTYRNAVIGFPNIVAQRAAPQPGDVGDVAIMRDGPANGDTINIGPGSATMTYGNGLGSSQANGYQVVHTYSDNGNDIVNMFDTNGNDTFFADRRVNHTNANNASRSGFAFMNDGGSTLFFAGGYWGNNGAAGTGTDTAILYDSNLLDSFTASPTSIRMLGQSASFDNNASGFDNNYGYSTNGPNNDQATFADSFGNDTFVVGSFNAWMQYPGNTTYVTGFYNTTVNSTNGGVDVASIFDSNSNDRLTSYANDNRVTMWQQFAGGSNWLNGYDLNDFNSVFATKTLGGTDVAQISPFDQVNLTLSGAWS